MAVSKRPTKGAPLKIDARDYGDILRMLSEWRRAGKIPSRDKLPSSPVLRRFKHTSAGASEDLLIGNVAKVTDVVALSTEFTTDQKITPTVSLNAIDEEAVKQANFGVVMSPASDKSFGYIALSGVCHCRVDILDEAHKFAEVFAGSVVARSAPVGPIKILKVESTGTGEKGCLVEIVKTPASALLPLSFKQISGDDGTSTSSASWAYDIKLYESSTILLADENPAVDPHKYKRPIGRRTIGDFGFGFFDSDDELIVVYVNEVIVAEPC